jgi:hypothetical protein
LTFQLEKKHYLFTSLVSIIPGLFVYFILSYLFVVPRITVPISILLPILIFGLIRYYSTSKIYANTHDADSNLNDNGLNDIQEQDRKRQNGAVASIFFAAIFAVLIVIFAFSGSDNFHVFIEWKEIGVIGIIQLVVAVALCFFIPGFAIVLILTRKYQMNPILTVLLGYFFSILISGLSAYIWALGFDTPISELKNFYIMLYSGILVIFLIFHSRFEITTRLDMRVQLDSSFHQFLSSASTQFLGYVKKKYPELLVFGSILMLLIISTYYLYNAVTISDQWFHQGRALLFLSGSFRETVIDGSDNLGYPPFQSGLLAALTTIAGVPIVNSYASIAFLNLVPVFAFYYFFSKWVPPKYYRASLLASSLFAIASGFNWIYLLGLTVTSNPITSQHSFLEILNSLRTVTIIRPTNFIFSAEPDFSTGLIYLALPAGLALLGVIQQRFNAKLHYVAIVAALSIVGILSHFEFFLFILVAALLPVIFKLEKQTYLYIGLMFSFLVVFLINTVLPGNYYSSDLFFGFSLLYLVVLFVSLTWVFYLALGKFRHLQIKLSTLHDLSRKFPKIKNRSYVLLGVLLISLTVYMFFLSYNVLVHLSTDYLKKNTEGYVVPWYVYPIKLGLPGLLGLVFIFSYFIKKFDNKLFVFGVLIIMALITGNFYDEHRFSKFVMLGTVAYASLLIYKIIKLDYINKIYLNGVLISALIVSSVLSVVLYIGSNSLVLQTKDFTINPKRNFPPMSEIRLYDKLLNSIDIGSKKYNIVSFPSEYNFVQGSPLMSKLQGFSGFPPETIFRNPLSLNSSTLDEFYRQLEDSDVIYIILPKASIKDKILLGEPIRFALQYFNRFYEDKDYIVLQVPPLKAPSLSPDAQVALLYDLGSDLPSPQVHNTILLPYNNATFDFGAIDQSRVIQKDPQGEKVTLLGLNVENGIPLWSRVIPPEQKINYIETKFRITSENENKSKTNDIRLKWWEGDKEFYVLLSKNGLELYRQSISNQSDKIILAKNPEVDKTIGKWYEVKVARSNRSISVFLDDVPKIQVAGPLIGIQNKSISRIGLTTLLNNVEFGPIKIAYEGSDLPSPQVHNTILLPYNNNTFIFKTTNESRAIQKDPQGEKVILLGSNIDKGIPLWSRVIPPEQKINYVETKFRITSENENKSKGNDIRLKWWEGNKEYYILLSKSGLELYQQSINNQSDRKILAENPLVEKTNGKWHTVKIARSNSSINVFVDDVPKIQAASPLSGMQNKSISRIGLTTLLNNVEFGPLKIGKVGIVSPQNYNKTGYYDFYYPLSLLALSDASYDIFNDDDLSAFSKDVIAISDALKPDDNKFNMYLDYVRGGGTLIVINSNNNVTSLFGQLFPLQSNVGKTEVFINIASNKNESQLVNVTGSVNRFEMQPRSDVNVIAAYKNKNNQSIAPFAIEKTFPNHGRIIFINARGYFDAISASPRQYFQSLGNFSEILGFKKEPSKQIFYSSQDKANSNGFIRNMDLNGKITVNASSVLLADGTSYPYPVNALRVNIFNKTNSPPITLNNVTLKSLNMIGRYNASIDFIGRIALPDSMSDRNYIGLSIPTDFNMTLNLHPKGLSYIEIVTENGTSTNTIKVKGESKMEFHIIRAYPPLKYVPVLLKNPEIKVNGETNISNGLQNGLLTKRGTLNTGSPLDIKGQLNAKFGFVDNYNQYYKNGTLINYITYLQAVTMNNTVHEHKGPLLLSADFSSLLYDRELVMAIQNALAAPSNIIVVVVLSIITIITIRIIQRNKNKNP